MSEFFKKPGKKFGKPGGFNRGGDRPNFGNHDRRDGERKKMFETICSNCQKPCEVPFRPNGSKPVYCKDCFRSMREEDEGMHSTREDFRPRREFAGPQRPQGDSKLESLVAQVNALNQKMDKVLAALLLNKSEAAPVVVADEEEGFSLEEAPAPKSRKARSGSAGKIPAAKSRKAGSASGGKTALKKK